MNMGINILGVMKNKKNGVIDIKRGVAPLELMNIHDNVNIYNTFLQCLLIDNMSL